MADSMGRRLAGRYEVRSLIGRGGMAEVHLGFDTRLSRVVAIKMLRSDLARDSVFQARFRREAQSAASLNHANIVAVYDTGEEMLTGPEGRAISVPYIVMEYVEGHTVKELLADGTPVPINEAVAIVSGVLGALEYSHSQHLVHRDIKPGNIMLTNDGKVKVMDFGIARAITDSQATMTQTNAVVGTAQYLSPEQARGEQVDARSDLYSTGVVLFELLTGRPPFTGDSAVAVAYQHVQQLPPTPSSITPDVPEALDRVVMKALAKDRTDRYTSAASMLADLMRASRGGHVNAPAVAVWEDTVPMAAANVANSQPTQTLPPAIASPSNATTTFAPVAAQELEEEPEKKSKKGIIVALVVVALLLMGAIWYALSHASSDKEMVAVPDNLIGMTQAEAKSAVESVGLVFAISNETVASDEIEEGKVAETDPPSGNQVEVGSTVTAKLSSGAESVVIPDNLVGMSPDAAKQAIEALGLVYEQTADPVASADVEEGKVAQVNPSVGSKVKKGSTVKVSLSSGPKSVEVPDVTGMTQDQAREALAAKGLTVGSVQVSDDPSQKEGLVISTNPAAGTSVNKDTAVTLTVSSGKITIPSGLVGYDQAYVVQTLQELGLRTSVTEQYSNDLETGGVLAVNPTEGSVVTQGSTVNLTVSKGPQPAPPNPNNSGQANSGS